uniref:Uncharacterized protein n=1 Tax=Rhizophora mucronata TaxID=61149 RepID=A0A2P2NSE2_RHIMU
MVIEFKQIIWNDDEMIQLYNKQHMGKFMSLCLVRLYITDINNSLTEISDNGYA